MTLLQKNVSFPSGGTPSGIECYGKNESSAERNEIEGAASKNGVSEKNALSRFRLI